MRVCLRSLNFFEWCLLEKLKSWTFRVGGIQSVVVNLCSLGYWEKDGHIANEK